MKEFITKVKKLGIPAGTKVTFNDDPTKDNRGKTGMLLCSLPGGSALFYKEDELAPTEGS